MTERDPELQRVIDESAIRRLLDNYPRALDRQDHALLASLFHPGAIDDHGVFNGPAAGFVEFMRGGSVPGTHWMHHNGTQIVEIEGDVANTETYTLAFCRQPPLNPGENDREIMLRVRYLDRVEKRNGEWKIAHRRVVYSPCQVLEVVEEWQLTPECLVEGGVGNDPVFHWKN
ncbi:MAG: nuclear transport factor 2 family protein [Spongiibacteraceae bacterium]